MNCIDYITKDENGIEIVKKVKIKSHETKPLDFVCKCCNHHCEKGVPIRKIVSSNFTDWENVGDYVCENCADLFSLQFYSYVVNPDGVNLINVRQIRDKLISYQKPPFLFVITTSKKKHLFYKSIWNNCDNPFAVNLETETIYTTRERMKQLFDFVESLQTLGCSKEKMKSGEISFEVLKKVGIKAYEFLQKELSTSREIQIPLYCGQKRNMSEVEVLCYINSILMM